MMHVALIILAVVAGDEQWQDFEPGLLHPAPSARQAPPIADLWHLSAGFGTERPFDQDVAYLGGLAEVVGHTRVERCTPSLLDGLCLGGALVHSESPDSDIRSSLTEVQLGATWHPMRLSLWDVLHPYATGAVSTARLRLKAGNVESSNFIPGARLGAGVRVSVRSRGRVRLFGSFEAAVAWRATARLRGEYAGGDAVVEGPATRLGEANLSSYGLRVSLGLTL